MLARLENTLPASTYEVYPAHYWAKKARDAAKVYGFDRVQPAFSDKLNIAIDASLSTVQNSCNGGFVGCYNPVSNTVFARRDREVTRNAGFIVHEIGHWWVGRQL